MKSAVLALALCGCTVVEHVQVFAPLSKDYQPEPGVVVYAEVPPTTRLNLSVVKGNQGVSVKGGIKWRF